jgi:surface carbohydrate biosynthesis protein
MPCSVDVVCLYEKALRELDVLCAIKALAERRGMSVEIVELSFGYGEAMGLRPRIVVLPYCYQERSNNFYLMRWRDATFVNFSWEQFFYPGNRIAKTPRGDFALNHVLHLSWSEGYSQLLRGAGVPGRSIVLTGNPALQLYREPYRHYFADRATLARRYGLDPARKWVFFPENYNWAFYEQPMLDQMVRDGQSPRDVAEMRAYTTASFETAMAWCARLVRESDAELVLRPRPATPLATMVERVRAAIGPLPERLHVLQDETVREWNLAADLVVSSYSTSLVEATIAGRRILMLEPQALPPALVQEWHHLVPRATRYEDFAACLAGSEPNGAPLARWAVETVSGPADPIMAIVDLLQAAKDGAVTIPSPATRESVLIDRPAAMPFGLWWLVRIGRSYLSQWKALSPWRRAVLAESAPDVAAARTIAQRAAHWSKCLSAS